MNRRNFIRSTFVGLIGVKLIEPPKLTFEEKLNARFASSIASICATLERMEIEVTLHEDGTMSFEFEEGEWWKP